MTVSLRDASADDALWLDRWLPAVAESVGYAWPSEFESSSSHDRANRVVRVIEADGERVGVAIARIQRDKPTIIEIVATPQEHARRGYGMRAAALIEHEFASLGVREIYAPAPAAHGIAMYFWIRLGYAPLARDAWPCDRDGVAWLSRRIVAAKRTAAR